MNRLQNRLATGLKAIIKDEKDASLEKWNSFLTSQVDFSLRECEVMSILELLKAALMEMSRNQIDLECIVNATSDHVSEYIMYLQGQLSHKP